MHAQLCMAHLQTNTVLSLNLSIAISVTDRTLSKLVNYTQRHSQWRSSNIYLTLRHWQNDWNITQASPLPHIRQLSQKRGHVFNPHIIQTQPLNFPQQFDSFTLPYNSATNPAL